MRGEGKKGLNFMGVKPASDVELGTLFFLDLEKMWREDFLWTPDLIKCVMVNIVDLIG